MICHNSFLIKHLLPNFCSTHTEVIRIFMWSIIRNALPLLLLVNFNFTIDTEATSLNTMGVNVFSKSLQLEKGKVWCNKVNSRIGHQWHPTLGLLSKPKIILILLNSFVDLEFRSSFIFWKNRWLQNIIDEVGIQIILW